MMFLLGWFSCLPRQEEDEWFAYLLVRAALPGLSQYVKPVSHAVHHRPWDHHRATHTHTHTWFLTGNACVETGHWEACYCAGLLQMSVCEAVSVSWSSIHPCVLWTKLGLSDIGKCNRSGEPVRQDFLSLFLHASSAPLAHFADPSSAFQPCLPLTFLIVWFSVVKFFWDFPFTHTLALPVFFLLLHHLPTLFIFWMQFFLSFCAQIQNRQEKAKGSGWKWERMPSASSNGKCSS